MFNFFKKQEKPSDNDKINEVEKTIKNEDDDLPFDWPSSENKILTKKKSEELPEEELPFDLPELKVEAVSKKDNKPEKAFDYLKDLSINLSNYLNYCKSVSVIMNDNISEIKRLGSEAGIISEQLMQKFDKNTKCYINPDEWSKYLDELKTTGETASDYVKRMLVQIKDSEEKRREFKRCFFGDLHSYFNNTLILIEEFRNISRFINQSPDIVKNIEIKSQKLKNDFLAMSSSLGVNFDNVPLFVNYEPYAANTKLVNQEVDPVYENVRNLKKDEIKEIFAYGFECDFSHSKEETLVSL
jgi:hypothetical protein